jgi:hypothetical protein
MTHPGSQSLIPSTQHRTLPSLRVFREVFLLTDRVRLGQPAPELRVDVLQRREAEDVKVIPRRKRLYGAKAAALQAPGEDDVSIEPSATRSHLREGHANVERDAGLFGKDLDWTDLANRRHDRIEQCTNLGGLSGEVMLEVVTTAGVRLIAVRELATAPLAAPQRGAAQSMSRDGLMRR